MDSFPAALSFRQAFQEVDMLEQPIRIGGVELKNRLAMAPMAVYKATEAGKVTPLLCAHYAERAQRSGVGLIITEHSYVLPQGKAKPRQVSCTRDEDAIGLSALADACHNNGVKAICQVSHAGGAARKHVTGLVPAAPSRMTSPAAIPAEPGEGEPQELSVRDIAEIVGAFAAAARRVRDAGFDGVEIHSAHAYLLDQFYSPLLNARADGYGGSLENRLRIHREVLAAVRQAVGLDFAVGVRLGGCDYEDGGATIADAVAAARALEEAGADYLSVSGGWHRYERPGHDEPGWFADQAGAVKAAVGIPVLLTGGVKEPGQAEELLSAGVCDIVGIGRALLKNPAWPEGR
jgi:2,4-dienoyl-CoA reductase-like NADH-dependent reductase (Old Yellow Enzyme family)